MRPSAFSGSNPLAVGSLLVANLFPLYAVLFLGWSPFSVLLLYWLESAVVGAYTLLEILVVGRAQALFLAPFFCIHYGMFMFGHMVFLWGVFGPGSLTGIGNAAGGPGALLANGWDPAVAAALLPWIMPLAASHGISFVVNVVSDFRSREASQAMFRPYGRIIFMHVTLMAGAFLMAIFRAPAPVFAAVVVAKTAVDLMSHLRTHQRRVVHAAAPATGPFA